MHHCSAAADFDVRGSEESARVWVYVRTAISIMGPAGLMRFFYLSNAARYLISETQKHKDMRLNE
jgi:hypothetical protein